MQRSRKVCEDEDLREGDCDAFENTRSQNRVPITREESPSHASEKDLKSDEVRPKVTASCTSTLILAVGTSRRDPRAFALAGLAVGIPFWSAIIGAHRYKRERAGKEICGCHAKP